LLDYNFILNYQRKLTKMSLEENIFMARVAEQAERFDDMVSYLVQVTKSKSDDFTTEERNLLSVGFKN
jgi:14-3-3 protein epsilon